MAEHADREHYIPLRKSDLVKLLSRDQRLTSQERDSFAQFCKLVSAVWHFEYHATLERLKDAYAPFDPDSACKALEELPREKRPAQMDRLFDEVLGLMEKANFKRLSRKDVEDAIDNGASDWGINMKVHWDVFERLEVFARGDGITERTKRHVLFFWRTITKQVPTYKRLILLVKLRKHKRLPSYLNVDHVFAKMFKEIPKVDLEMTLPGTSLQMPWHQTGRIGLSAVGTIGYGLFQFGWKIFSTILGILSGAVVFTLNAATFAMLTPFFILFGYGYKQYYSYQVTKTNYSKLLAENLYYLSLDNNLGVITQVTDEAEEQECRETFLAYFYLWKYAPPGGWGAAELDEYVEMELEGKLGMKVDFEIGDALGKLETLGIVRKNGDKYVAVGIDKALELIDHRWDNYFQYNV